MECTRSVADYRGCLELEAAFYSLPRVVAEIGCNHKGDLEIAHQFIKVARNFCGVSYVKFQKRTPKELLSPEEYNAPHPVPENSYGRTYGEHRERLEFGAEQHRILKQWCEEEGLVYACSVWDMTAAREIVALNPEYIKVPSATNTNHDVLRYLCDNYGGAIHMSLGMTTRREEEAAVEIFRQKGRLADLVLYACTSGYPIPFEEAYLLEIVRLRETYGGEVAAIGYSGHHLGIAADVAAYTLGATWIERHFTLDRTWKGTDHAASLEPDGLRRLVRDLQHVYLALRYRDTEISPIEEAQRKKLKWQRTTVQTP